ncbi:MAG: DUF692 family protein [Myxococcales bacterium]|nr:DUF692 family protein [Myxococcales bacterium]
MRRTPPALGVGLSCASDSAALWEAVVGDLDYIEVTPEHLCRERLVGARRAMCFVPGALAATFARGAGLPFVAHGVELSIGSAGGWNPAYVDMLDELWATRPFAWHSEHLGFLLAPGDAPGATRYAGVPLPLPTTDEALDLVAPRAAALVERYPVPFLLENGVHYLPRLPGARDELEFLDALCERSGCDLLLDLFNFTCNAHNHGFDPLEALARLRLDRVVEIHVAGGATHDGYLLDAHSGAVPADVWPLVDHVVAGAPRLAGITFEILEDGVARLGVAGIREQLARARESWRLRPAAGALRVAC